MTAATLDAPPGAHDTPPPAGLIYAAMCGVMADVAPVGKDGTNREQGYKFRAIEDVMVAVKAALVKNRVFYLPTVLTRIPEERRTSGGKAMNVVHLEIRYRFYATDGSWVESVVWGEGADMADKATNKSMTAALKYNLVQALSIAADNVLNDGDREHVEAGRDEAWRNQPPVNRNGNGNGRPASRPAAPPPPPPPAPLAPDDPWADAIDGIADVEEGHRRYAEVIRLHKDGTIDLPRRDHLLALITARGQAVGEAQGDPAPQAGPPPVRAEDQGGRPAQRPAGSGDDDAWISAFMERLGGLDDLTQVTPMMREVGQAVIDRKVTSATSRELTAAVKARQVALEADTAAAPE